MSILKRLFGGGKPQARDGDAIAQGIVGRYHQRQTNGEFRVDDKLWLELTQVLPEEEAREIFGRFRKRLVLSDPSAERILLQEIGVAVHDVDLRAATAKPVMRESEEVLNLPANATLKDIAVAKVLAGQPLTDAEEDAMLFDT